MERRIAMLILTLVLFFISNMEDGGWKCEAEIIKTNTAIVSCTNGYEVIRNLLDSRNGRVMLFTNYRVM